MQAIKRMVTSEMCELYNLFTKSCKAYIQKAPDFYTSL
jgi:hypothetical protein